MKKPILRLYVAGEISSIYGHLYLEAGNITECLVLGNNELPLSRYKKQNGNG